MIIATATRGTGAAWPLGWMLVITQHPLRGTCHVSATLPDHRGVIKAAVTVVNKGRRK